MFPPMLVGAVVGGAAASLNLWNHYRQQLGAMTLREARLLASLEPTPIGHARDGFVKLVGTVGGLTTEMSYYQRVPCAALEWHHYELSSAAGAARRVLVRKESRLHPFWIEDDTGRLVIDPSHARLDFEVEGAELESILEEHRLRVGEKVAVLGHVRRTGIQLTQPMRVASTNFEQGLELVGAPLVTWRSEPEVYPRLRPPTGATALSVGSAWMAVLGSVLNL